VSSLSSLEKRIFEDLFGMSSGYVLNYNNATFAELFRESVNINIHDEKYAFNGDSKAKRLRAFWEVQTDLLVGKVLASLLEVWSYENPTPDKQTKVNYDKALAIANRLQGKTVVIEDNEDTFLKQQFSKLDISKIGLDASLLPVIQERLNDAQKCLKADAPLAVIFLTGSILEGVLLDVASKNPQRFNQAKSSPKDMNGKVKIFPEWSLAQLINTASEVGFLKLDVKKFSHELRDFRNYIHPFQQSLSRFSPTKHTAEICLQVLKAAMADLTGDR
jgi:hypothetical protein